MHDEAWVFVEPCQHGRMLVGGIVVSDQLQRLALRRFTINLFQEFQPLGVSVVADIDR